MTRSMRTRRDDRGTIALELVVIFPVLIAFLFLVVGAGQIASARGDLVAAAQSGARAAVAARSASAARARGEAAALASLRDSGACARTAKVQVDPGGFQPGGSVQVVVSCPVDLDGLSAFGLFDKGPTVRTSARATIDTYRVVEGSQ